MKDQRKNKIKAKIECREGGEMGHTLVWSFPVAKAKTEVQSVPRFTISIDGNKLILGKSLDVIGFGA